MNCGSLLVLNNGTCSQFLLRHVSPCSGLPDWPIIEIASLFHDQMSGSHVHILEDSRVAEFNWYGLWPQ